MVHLCGWAWLDFFTSLPPTHEETKKKQQQGLEDDGAAAGQLEIAAKGIILTHSRTHPTLSHFSSVPMVHLCGWAWLDFFTSLPPSIPFETCVGLTAAGSRENTTR